jgi:hypothetical protein
MSKERELLRRALEAYDHKEEPYFERLHHAFEDIRSYLDAEPAAWQGLKMHEVTSLWSEALDPAYFARAIEQALKEKNAKPAQPEAEPVALKHRLLQIHDALESLLGDSDSWTSEDMTDEEIREEDPIFWAAKEIASLIGDAPWDQYLHPPKPAEPARKPMTHEEIVALFESENPDTYFADFRDSIRLAERHHGIANEP